MTAIDSPALSTALPRRGHTPVFLGLPELSNRVGAARVLGPVYSYVLRARVGTTLHTYAIATLFISGARSMRAIEDVENVKGDAHGEDRSLSRILRAVPRANAKYMMNKRVEQNDLSPFLFLFLRQIYVFLSVYRFRRVEKSRQLSPTRMRNFGYTATFRSTRTSLAYLFRPRGRYSIYEGLLQKSPR